MAETIPFATEEVRWFFEGRVDEHDVLKRWFDTAAPVAKQPGVGPPVWKGRLDDQPDVYLIVPGSDDMGIKWREGQLQIKGCVQSLGSQRFCGRHQGTVERWMKWSYAETPPAYQQLFLRGKEAGLITASVRKTRALRKIRLGSSPEEQREVDVSTPIERGLGFELTDIEVAGNTYCSVAFEAYPSDAAMNGVFGPAVEAFLRELTDFHLSSACSRSYPAWLAGIVENNIEDDV